MEHSAETATGKWSAPECPLRIEYSMRVLDDIRLAVVDAFFSVPRGGAEIGGILLGKHEGDLIAVTDYEALDCEHAMGPSFTLSPRDQTHLAEMTARARRNPPHRQPIGWYHSHTRSGIFLSDTDQDIHKRFFPEPWQVALVLKPHTFEPTRGGFFFREPDGTIRGNASYQEFVLEPLPTRPLPAGNHIHQLSRRPMHEDETARGPVAMPPPAPAGIDSAATAMAAPERGKGRVPITREIPAAAPFAARAGDEPAEIELDALDAMEAPHFTQLKQERSLRVVKVVACLAVGLALGGVGYQTRAFWLPQVLTKLRPMLPKEPDAYLSLSVSDDNGQLKIQWDRNAPAVRNALEATIEIADGKAAPQPIRLDGAHLAIGSFTYGRESERVDVTLIASEPGGEQVRESRSFFGKLPGEKGQGYDSEVRKERDALAEKAEKLQKDLASQASRTRKLEKDLKDMKDEFQNDQKKRSTAPAGNKND